MSKVIVVSYTDGDYEPYFELYSYSPAIVETLKENLKKKLFFHNLKNKSLQKNK